MSMGQGQAPSPRRARPRPAGSPNGFSPLGGGGGSPLGPPPVGQSQGTEGGAMGMYRNAILRRMQGTAGGQPPVGGPMPGAQAPGMGQPPGMAPGMAPPPGGPQQALGGPQMVPPGQAPPQMEGGAEGVQGMIQNLLRTRNSRRVLGGASGPLGQ